MVRNGVKVPKRLRGIAERWTVGRDKGRTDNCASPLEKLTLGGEVQAFVDGVQRQLQTV
jgi:hypothetical protein